MIKKRKITAEMIRGAIKPRQLRSLPIRSVALQERIQHARETFLPTERIDFVNSDAAEQFFLDVLSGKRAPAAKGRFSAKSCQPQNIPRSALVNMDYAEIERRVTGMHPALGAPYGQSEEDKTNG